MARETHDFYCMSCGNKGIPLSRNVGFQHSKFHRKKLYCVFCKREVNHVECRNQMEVNKFKEDFSKGLFAEEAEASIEFLRR